MMYGFALEWVQKAMGPNRDKAAEEQHNWAHN
jgi:hypothetical protein